MVGFHRIQTMLFFVLGHLKEFGYFNKLLTEPNIIFGIFLTIITYCFHQANLKLFKDVKSPNGLPSGVLIPIPQYPLYSASLAEYNLFQVSDRFKRY